jgi:hypothetical protein
MAAGAAVFYVDLNSPNPTAPYADWSTAATNIQHAIDAAAAGDTVLVTNGVYASGGKVKSGDLTNRVALDKEVVVQSVNGPWFTTIRGHGATNGNAAVRCAWITNGAVLQGFTLTAGATRSSGDSTNLQSGGAALCVSSNALVRNCLIISNVANSFGGGVYQGALQNCALLGNRAGLAGSAAAYASQLNCNVISNLGTAVIFRGRLTNSIVYYNAGGVPGQTIYSYCCTLPLPPGEGNISTPPQLFLDNFHLTLKSPSRGAGQNITIGPDIFGRSCADPPTIGCAERNPIPLLARPRIQQSRNPNGITITLTN